MSEEHDNDLFCPTCGPAQINAVARLQTQLTEKDTRIAELVERALSVYSQLTVIEIDKRALRYAVGRLGDLLGTITNNVKAFNNFSGLDTLNHVANLEAERDRMREVCQDVLDYWEGDDFRPDFFAKAETALNQEAE